MRYVDDSKATNPHAAAASLQSFEHVVWIAGGLLKGADVDDLVPGRRRRLRAVVLIGADRARLAEALAPTRAGCPRRRGREHGHWGHGDRRRSCGRARPAGRRRAARARGRLDGHVPELRCPGRCLRRGGRPPRRVREETSREQHHRRAPAGADRVARRVDAGPAGPGRRLAPAARLPGHDLLRAARRDRGARRHRADHGAVRVVGEVARADRQRDALRRSSASSCSSPRWAPSPWRSPPGCPLRAWKALSVPILVGALFLQLLVFTPLGVLRQRQPQLARRRADLDPARRSSPRSGSSWSVPPSCPPSASCSAGCGHVIVPFLFPVAGVTIGAGPARPRPRHRHGHGRDRRGPALRRRGAPSDVRLRRRAVRGPGRDAWW